MQLPAKNEPGTWAGGWLGQTEPASGDGELNLFPWLSLCCTVLDPIVVQWSGWLTWAPWSTEALWSSVLSLYCTLYNVYIFILWDPTAVLAPIVGRWSLCVCIPSSAFLAGVAWPRASRCSAYQASWAFQPHRFSSSVVPSNDVEYVFVFDFVFALAWICICL